MALAPGSRIGVYEILSPLGEGGMGVVYRARDTKLDRDVAIKILPESFASDPDRVMRFEREAKTLAALNHPNIAHIHGLEESAGTHALVMELVDGDDLSHRISRGAMPIDEALPIAKQIAEALEAAHEQGIIHRDLKPANVKVRPDGTVKVLDFGLAKALDQGSGIGDRGSGDLANSPTITSPAMTQRGVILGTAAYMSPEQAKGRAVDKRADIWAFGVVLYEMLTGRRLFDGESMAEVISSALRQDIDLATLPDDTPRGVRRLLERCLDRDPRQRLRDIGEARVALAAPGDAGEAPAAMPVRRWTQHSLLLLALGLVAGAGAALALSQIVAEPAPAPIVSRFRIALPPDMPLYTRNFYPFNTVAISRDGATLAFLAGAGEQHLYLRRHDELEAREISGADGACNPFFSPDGNWIAFFGKRLLRKVSVAGGEPVIVARDMPDCGWGGMAAWSDGDRIVFDQWAEGLRVMPSEGGAVSALTKPAENQHLDPQVLPGTDSVLYFAQDDSGQRIETIAIDGSKQKTVVTNASHPRYLASGHLLFMRDGGLWVAPFDKNRVEVNGAPTAVPLDVEVDARAASAPLPQLAVSFNGTLAYAPVAGNGNRRGTLVWVDRQGRVTDSYDLPLAGVGFSLSPDGKRLALAGRNGPSVQTATYDLDQKALTPLTEYPQEFPNRPAWFPDGRRTLIGRYGIRDGELLSLDVEANAPAISLVKLLGTWISPGQFSADGRYATFSILDAKTRSQDLWLLEFKTGGTATARPFLATPAFEYAPALSPDGQWFAYNSDETGQYEVYLRRFPGGESKRRVSKQGGSSPEWSRDGRELFFTGPGGKVMAVSLSFAPALTLSEPQLLFQGPFRAVDGMGIQVSADAKRFLLVRSESGPNELVIVQNWLEEIRKLTTSK